MNVLLDPQLQPHQVNQLDQLSLKKIVTVSDKKLMKLKLNSMLGPTLSLRLKILTMPLLKISKDSKKLLDKRHLMDKELRSSREPRKMLGISNGFKDKSINYATIEGTH